MKKGITKRRHGIRTHKRAEDSHLTTNLFKKKFESDFMSKFKHDIDLNIENTGEIKQLVKDGVWQVPIEARPKGWEKMGLKEKG